MRSASSTDELAGDEQHRHAAAVLRAQAPDVAQHGALGDGVECAGGIVEDEDVGRGEQRAGKAKALALAAGKGDAPVPDTGFEAIGQAGQNLLRSG